MDHSRLIDRVLRKLITSLPLPVRAPRFGPAPVNPSVCSDDTSGRWYPPLLAGVAEIGSLAVNPCSLTIVEQVLTLLEHDEFVSFLLKYYSELREHLGLHARYADVTTALVAAAQVANPRSYLEIGVRRGRSLCVVASSRPGIDIVGFDLWLANYANLPNPGPDFVRAELAKVGHRGRLELVSGNSHLTVPRYLREHPDHYYDLIVVDGDHTRRGASLDLRNVLPRLAIGGVIVLDDIAHPKHPHLGEVWTRYIGSDPRFAAWQYTDTGFGVAIGVRKY